MTGPTNGPTGLAALRRLTWWGLLGCLAVVAGLVAAESVDRRPAPAGLGTVPAAVLACAVAGRLFAVAVAGVPRPGPAATRWLVGAATLAAGAVVALSRAADSGGFPAALPLAALLAGVWAGSGWSAWWSWPGAVGVALGSSLLGSGSTGAVAFSAAAVDAGIAALGAAGLYAQVWVLTVAERLDRGRRLERAAAVADERVRFAADLHDIQGHTLQVIALKSELAERLADADPARAAAEMRDVQNLARQALGDTRAVVNGYRAVSLETEIANATRVLDAAGIRSSMSRTADLPTLPPAVQNLLGLVVRECTTNVLRHSTARHCDVSLSVAAGTVLLRFSNDAPLGEPPGPAGGLAGLADRLAAAGGRLVPHGTADAFTVSAYLPMPVVR